MSTLTITIIQSNLHWEDKAANLAMFEAKINSIRERTEVVVLPEMFSTGFSMQPDKLAETMERETVQWMKRVAAEKKIILTGSIIIKEEGARPHTSEDLPLDTVHAAESVPALYYNRLIWMLPNGQFGYYDKRHRFAFAGEDLHYTSGNKRLIASVKGWKINLMICYDLRFPVWARQTPSLNDEGQFTEPEFDLIIYVANWPEKRIHAWKTLLQARAIENQCFVVGTNRLGDDNNGFHYSGESMVLDPMGETLYHKKDEEAIFTITIDKEHLQQVREKFPFWKDGDLFTIEK
jgi:predicted amidohydrolase